MRIARLCIENFRGIRHATLLLPKHEILIGDNNTGRTTALEALDLALGPERLHRVPPISEHDFYNGHYFNRPSRVAASGEIGEPSIIRIEVVIVHLILGGESPLWRPH
ncbi:AAA family ATPase [Paraburkholderia sp. LEh10]|uniref:AAA family ATPase n=1 Tax=Paraburkholderia sp. LEh10 TaxID=2821353 RepID=UPI001AE9D94D|nr:AAA family ATPase [Paraburkholderia sp. LEh10]MBP0596212.1 AAA family ATPase [Paraburkholderia sp. LEh10]